MIYMIDKRRVLLLIISFSMVFTLDHAVNAVNKKRQDDHIWITEEWANSNLRKNDVPHSWSLLYNNSIILTHEKDYWTIKVATCTKCPNCRSFVEDSTFVSTVRYVYEIEHIVNVIRPAWDT